MPICRKRQILARFASVLLIAAAGSACAFGLPINPADSNNAQGLLNVLAASTDSAATAADPSYSVGGTVSGLSGGGLALMDSVSGGVLAVASDGSVAMSGFSAGASYNISVSSQPTGPHQTCSVTNGSGTVSGGDVSDLLISCTTNTYTVGGTVAGLSGSGLVLQNNGGDNLNIAGNGSFTFATSVASGNVYAVTVLTQPSTPSQTCSVSGGSGTVVGGNVTSVTINCSTSTYTIGGNVSGLSGSGLVLQNNGGDDLNIAANGSFSFATALADLSSYSVTVLTQPSSPSQTCSVSSGSGSLSGANVTSVSITCTTNTYTVGGTVSGLSGAGLVLQNNGGDNLSVSSNGSFTFATSVASGNGYSVTVLTQPSSPTQTCVVSGGSGTVVSANIASVSINCTTNTYTVGGTVSGLSGTGLVLQNNGGDNLNIGGNGSFSFATSVASGNGYSVTVLTQPSSPTQTCSVSSGSGTVGGSNVTGVSISCTTNTYTVGGTVSGLSGSGLVLQNNGGDNLAVAANGSFTFATSITSGNAYSVTVQTQPSSPNQTCGVTSGSGTVTSANITSVSISCVTTQYTVSVTVGEMGSSSGLVLQNNGGDNQTINADGSYSFSAQDDGTAYSISILTQPTSPASNCIAYNTSGTMSGANVTNVTVSCVDPINDFSDLGMWLRADTLGLGNSVNVTTWTDASGNGKSPTATTASNPVNYTNVQNGLPAVFFSSGANLSLDSTCVDSTGNGITIVALVSSNNTSGSPRFIWDQNGYNGGNYNYGIDFTNNTGQLHTSSGNFAFSVGKSAGQFTVVSAVWEFDNGTGTTGKSYLYLDGTLAGSDTDGNNLTAANDAGSGNCTGTWGSGPGPQTLGGQSKVYQYNGRSLNGYIAEFLWYGQAMSAADRESLECMLKTKYNLTGVSNGTCP